MRDIELCQNKGLALPLRQSIPTWDTHDTVALLYSFPCGHWMMYISPMALHWINLVLSLGWGKNTWVFVLLVLQGLGAWKSKEKGGMSMIYRTKWDPLPPNLMILYEKTFWKILEECWWNMEWEWYVVTLTTMFVCWNQLSLC